MYQSCANGTDRGGARPKPAAKRNCDVDPRAPANTAPKTRSAGAESDSQAIIAPLCSTGSDRKRSAGLRDAARAERGPAKTRGFRVVEAASGETCKAADSAHSTRHTIAATRCFVIRNELWVFRCSIMVGSRGNASWNV